MNEVQVSYLPRAGSHWGCQHRASEMNYLSAHRVTAPSYLIWLSYHLLRRCQPCSIYCSEALSKLRHSPAKRGSCISIPFKCTTLLYHCYAIKSRLLNRSVYWNGNNDHFKRHRVMTRRTRERICMPMLGSDVTRTTLPNFCIVKNGTASSHFFPLLLL